MTERQMAALAQREADQEKYIRQVASTPQGAAEQISSAKALLDSGTISQEEFEALKAKALA
jgi:hypothetical protein